MTDQPVAFGYITGIELINIRAFEHLEVDLSGDKGPRMLSVIIGRNSTCKSTLLRCVNALERPDAGTITVDGRRVDADDRSIDLHRAETGMVFQAFNLIPVLSAAENVEFVMLLQGIPANERRQRTEAILDDVGLTGKYDRRPTELSGGQQQRVAVARAIAAEPAVVR